MPQLQINCRLDLTHWDWVTHLYFSKVTIFGSDNGLSPVRRQAIIWTNAVLLSIGPLGTKFSQIVFEIQTISFKKMYFKMSSGKWRPFCLCLNVLTLLPLDKMAAILADDIFKCIFWNEKFCIMNKISLRFVPKDPIDNNPALVQIMAWCRIGDRPLSEPVLTRFTEASMWH